MPLEVSSIILQFTSSGATVETFCLVRPEHLNHHGYLFGGQLLKWSDEFAWMAASKDYPGRVLVTRAMHSLEFKQRVVNGAILRFNITRQKIGYTSVTYLIQVHADEPSSSMEKEVFSTSITFVSVDERGKKRKLILND